MKEILIPAIVSLFVSAVYCRISADWTFKIIDDYVKEVVEIAKKSIRDRAERQDLHSSF